MILLEGSDCVGKTTLANALFKRIPEISGRVPMMRHFTKLPVGFDRYWGYRESLSRNVIMDRFHMSGIVYPIMYGDKHDLTPFKYSLIDADIVRAGGVVVVIAPDNAVIEKRWAEQPPDRVEMYDLKQVLQVNDIFREIARTRHCETSMGTYDVKIDVTFWYEEHTDHMADVIISQWVANQMQLDNVLRAKPLSLD